MNHLCCEGAMLCCIWASLECNLYLSLETGFVEGNVIYEDFKESNLIVNYTDYAEIVKLIQY